MKTCALIAFVLCAAACSHLTVAPAPTEAHSIAMGDTNQPDADIIDGDASGEHVRQGWMSEYAVLEAKFKETDFAADTLIRPEADPKFLKLGSKFVVPYKCESHFTDMKRKARLAEVGP